MTGLSLRSKLTFAFALLALVPLAAWLPLALKDLRRTLGDELEARADAALLSTRADVERRCHDAERAVRDLLDSPALEEIARRSRTGTPPSGAAQRAMEARGLTVLAVLGEDGKTLSSGHLPARFLDPDPALRLLAERARGACRIEGIEVPEPNGLVRVPAIVAGGLFEYGEARLWVVGGTRLDTGFVEQLARLTGTRAMLRGPEGVLAISGPSPRDGVVRALALTPQLSLELSVDRAALRAAEGGLTRAFLSLAALGLLLALALGVFLARRLTRPLEALTEGARAVAGGALDTRITVAASGEVGVLLEAFNQMTENLRRATEEKLAAERIAAWQEIARSLAHELKNPLTPIQMSLETLAAAAKSDHPRFRPLFQESVAGMLEEVDRLRRTVDAFSRFARLPKPQRLTLDLSELARQVLAVHGTGTATLRFDVQLEPGLTIEGDRDQLTQLLVNLIGNAREALAERSGRIEVQTRSAANRALLIVSDDGPGIATTLRPRLFEPYFTTKSGGTGLGLAISARIAQEHGGRLELLEGPGPGARFQLSLPRTGAS